MDDRRIVWLNLSGSGNETAAHLLASDRMTLMFCVFEGDPLILRLYGRARTINPRDMNWAQHTAPFPSYSSARQVIVMRIERVQTSCGSRVPFMDLRGQRGETELEPFYAAMGRDGVREYWRRKNARSIDRLATGLLEG